MNITINNKSQTFGMACKLTGNASRKIARCILENPNPITAEKTFFDAVNELNKLGTKVQTDGDKVIISDLKYNKQYEIPDLKSWGTNQHKEINYPIKILDGKNSKPKDAIFSIQYKEPQDIGSPAWRANTLYKGVISKILNALEITKKIETGKDRIIKEYPVKDVNKDELNKISTKIQNLLG